MARRVSALLAVLGVFGLLAGATAQPTGKADAAKAKKALQEVQDFVGVWNLEGTQKAGAKTDAWKEKVSWGWKFRGDDAWIAVEFGDGQGKYYSRGDLKYLTDKKKYQLTLTPAKGEPEVYTGDLARGTLKVERKDAKLGDVTRLTMNTAADGIRFVLKAEKQEGGKGLFAAAYQMAGNKDGESLGAAAKKPECVVTGGAASIAVVYQGQTYYVCCSGCRDAFNETPEKFVKKK